MACAGSRTVRPEPWSLSRAIASSPSRYEIKVRQLLLEPLRPDSAQQLGADRGTELFPDGAE